METGRVMGPNCGRVKGANRLQAPGYALRLTPLHPLYAKADNSRATEPDKFIYS